MKDNAIKYLIALATAGAGIKVRFKGTQAYTDGKMINLPAAETPESKHMSPGYAWHESLHILFTDFDLYKRYKSDLQSLPLLPQVINAIEDGRIERNGKRSYPGISYTINKLIEHVKSKGDTLFNAPEEKTDPANALLGYVLNWTRWNINGYSSITEMPKWRAALVKHIGEQTVGKIDSLLETSRGVSTTEDVFHVSKEILKVIKQAAQDTPQQQSGGGNEQSGDDQPEQGGDVSGNQSNDSSESEDSESGGSNSSQGAEDSQSESGGSSTSQDEDGGEDDGACNAGSEGTDDSSPKGDGSEGQTESGQGQASDGSGQEHQERAQAILDATGDNLAETDLGDIAAGVINEAASENTPSDDDSFQQIFGGLLIDPASPATLEYTEIAAPAAALASRLRGRLQEISRNKKAATRRSGRRLNRKKLTRVALDDSRIWVAPGRAINTDAHVHMILDTSGSMGDEIENLRRFSLSTARAIESVANTSLSVVSLTRPGGTPVVKHKEEKVSAVASRFRDLCAGGGTPITETLACTKSMVLNEQKPLRIVVIFTDGDPNNAHSLRSLVEDMTCEGIRFSGVILGRAINQLDDIMPCSRIDSLAQLPIVVSDLIAVSVKEANYVG
jgi:Mg-chelatase subunit ChlD